MLLAKLAGALKALPTRAAGLFQAPLSQVARLAKALEEKKPAGRHAPAPRPAAEAPCRQPRHRADAEAPPSRHLPLRPRRDCRSAAEERSDRSSRRAGGVVPPPTRRLTRR